MDVWSFSLFSPVNLFLLCDKTVGVGMVAKILYGFYLKIDRSLPEVRLQVSSEHSNHLTDIS